MKHILTIIILLSLFGAQKIQAQSTGLLVEADGGISPKNIALCKEAGLDIAVAGSSVFRAADPAAAIAAMK